MIDEENFISLNLEMQSDGSLVPSPNGLVEGLVQFDTDDQGVKIAKIIFGGLVQAHATYNMGGDKVLTYTLLSLTPMNPSIETSVENIIQYLNS